jgi:myxalamid-type nonribosomal peptide synthetase MxaA
MTLRALAVEVAARMVPGEPATAEPTPSGPLLRAEAELEPTLAFSAGRASPIPREILITGATGFLGAFLLAELLRQTPAKLHCLVRAETASEGFRRLAATFARYDLAAARLADRIVCIPGDLAQPRLGLTEADFNRVAQSIDAIVHSGASVNFVYPYEKLCAPNVHGTREILRLAASGRAKRLHYVSTIGVFPAGPGERGEVLETQRSLEPERLALGYMRAKWVAEELVAEASARGLETAVHRPGTISGHSLSGAFNPDDFLCVMIKGCIELGVAPAVSVMLNLAPVDYVSRAIVSIALSEAPPTGAYHLVNPTPVSFQQLLGWLRQLGYPLAEVPYDRWRKQLLETAVATGNALAPLLPLFADRSDTDWLMFPPFDAARTERALLGTGIACPAIDLMLVRRYVDRLVASGFLPPAPGSGEPSG